MGYGAFRDGRHTPVTPWDGSWAQIEEESRRVRIPRSRPHSREPIPPVERHKDRKNDYQRRPKHRYQEEQE